MATQKHSAHIPSDAALCELSIDKKAAKALSNVEAKYPHVVPGNIWRAGDGKHLLVLIRCTTGGCEEQRCVATSDCFQVKHCSTHKGGKATATEATEAAPVRVLSKGGRKTGRGTPKAGKAKGKARKGRSVLARAVSEIKARASRKGE